MKLTSVLLCAGFLQLSAHGFSQEKISVDYNNINIGKLLNVIGNKSDYTFLYKNAIIPDKKISIKMKDAPVRDILNKALEGTSLDYKILKDNLVVIVEAGDPIQHIHVRGKVTDEAGLPLIGVTVLVKGTTQGAKTDENGRFDMDVPENSTLEFTYVGYEAKQMTAKKDQSYNIALKANSSGLNEVVVVGYGKQKRINLSGAVDAISGKELESRPITNLGTGLQGLLPNLNITNSSGRSSDAAKFNLRGMTSINGGDPFILVDNIPFTNEEVSRLNPADVESVTILKDAASAAIYGARAAFGVVLITTKSGKDGRIAMTANANYAVRTLGRVPKMVTDPLTVMQYKHDAATPLYDLYPPSQRAHAEALEKDPSLPRVIINPTNKDEWFYYGTTDWLREVYAKSAPSYNANFSISRGDEKLNYYLSGEYFGMDGMMRYNPDTYKRYNLRAKATYTFNDRFKIGTNTMYTNTTYNEPSATYSKGNYFHNANRTPSLSIPRNPDGTWTSDGAALLGTLQEGGRRINTWGEFMTTINTEIGLIKDVWTLKGDATFRRGSNLGQAYELPVAYRKGPKKNLEYTSGNQSWAQNSDIDVKYNVYNVYSDFHKTFNKKHAVGALVGFNQEYHYYNQFVVKAMNLISNQYPTTQLTTGNMTQDQQIEDWAVRGIFYRVNYAYDDKYLLELNARNDGSSRFRSDNRWGFFPSASAAWVVSKEKFFAGVKQAAGLDFLKLRASYGSLGDQQWDPYGYMPLMKRETINAVLDGKLPIGVLSPDPVTATYTWQQVKTINGGIDFSLLKERLSFSYDRYTRYTNGMFAKSQELPNTYGAPAPRTNSADLKTRGWEMTISWRDQFKIGKDDFSYGIRFLMADSRSFITRFANPTGTLKNYDASDLKDRNYYNGQEIGDIWGLVTEGFFQSQAEIDAHPDQTKVGSDDQNYKFYVGDLKFKNLDGNTSSIDYGDNTISNPGDRKIIGNSAARFPYSVDLTAAYKGFDFRALIQGIGKRDWYPNAGNHYFWGVYAQPWTNVQLHNLDHWTPENPDAYFPRVKSYIAEDKSELGAPQTRYLQNAAYARLKNVTLGYTLPKKLTEKYRIARLRFYFSAENIFTISHLKANIDPEGLEGSLYPYQKTYSCGFNLNF
ncbi:SusC/RagA family TonB-linked outer membrane protein [Chitinophaga nivalis]|uniref:SusC/RagA family TonB-linked outer membrane protein n=1 Tax=Chitinophaga nivalis TaxID=2991709 RepID=A0ABT3IEP1_9BACT|nr:SusC/RagA family TonB-linked outer membrane protein [Chitinophaga nivalis]MCW3467892.1 SusC/RagA family TonB-linked outer membrane protein [Chitinophaga nivalis]MCW3482417.1 SusC/RagA family TonB-linked outer membrane protein [Chitinophaga nivalis]